MADKIHKKKSRDRLNSFVQVLCVPLEMLSRSSAKNAQLDRKSGEFTYSMENFCTYQRTACSDENLENLVDQKKHIFCVSLWFILFTKNENNFQIFFFYSGENSERSLFLPHLIYLFHGQPFKVSRDREWLQLIPKDKSEEFGVARAHF